MKQAMSTSNKMVLLVNILFCLGVLMTNLTISSPKIRPQLLPPMTPVPQNVLSLTFPTPSNNNSALDDLVLSYYSGQEIPLELFNIFIRSLRSTGCRATVVFLIHGFQPSQTVLALSETFDVRLFPVPQAMLESVPWSDSSVLFRFRAWLWFLEQNYALYRYVLNADLDVYFQTDPFACFFGDSRVNEIGSVLHVFSENPAVLIGECSVHKRWYENDCDGLGLRLFESHRHRERICAGFTIGDIHGHRAYLAKMTEFVNPTCNDQAIHNMMIWENMLNPVIDHVYIWDYFEGPVKTIDVGYLQDEFGRVINEKGLPYCVVHQFKPGRNANFVEGLNKLFPIHEKPARTSVIFDQHDGITCAVDECKGLRVHPSTQFMIDKQIRKAWWGPEPQLKRMWMPRGLKTQGYALISSGLNLSTKRSGIIVSAYGA